MNARELREQSPALPGAVEEFPFGDKVSVFKAGGKPIPPPGPHRERLRPRRLHHRLRHQDSDLPAVPAARQPGFAPVGLNDSLMIVGNVKMDGYSNGWLLRAGDTHPTLLPSFRYHHTNPRHINSSGLITGQLSTDNEQHVVLWTPRR